MLPSPLSIAFLLTLATAVAALLWGNIPQDRGNLALIDWWVDGLWQPSLMVFAMQMMLMLVLGHTLALSPVVSGLIDRLIKPCTDSARAAAIVAFYTMLAGMFNWGLGLVFGAIMARRVGERAVDQGRDINYPLIGAAGYTGMLVWHGGLSGSSLIKVAESGHLRSLMDGDLDAYLPEALSLGDTVFSSLNIFSGLTMILVIPTLLYLIGKFTPGSNMPDLKTVNALNLSSEPSIGAEKLDQTRVFPLAIGLLMLLFVLYRMFFQGDFLNFFTPNNINFLLLSLCLLGHDHIKSFTASVDEAIRGASGILIQFPLYFGILALIKESGLIHLMSHFFIAISNPVTYPIFTFISAGIVNIFVPSGGGQWAIQGPVIIQSTHELGVPLYKSILAFAYGDQITNMLQPFWALPLLGITKLQAREILPFTLAVFLAGSVIFGGALLLF